MKARKIKTQLTAQKTDLHNLSISKANIKALKLQFLQKRRKTGNRFFRKALRNEASEVNIIKFEK